MAELCGVCVSVALLKDPCMCVQGSLLSLQSDNCELLLHDAFPHSASQIYILLVSLLTLCFDNISLSFSFSSDMHTQFPNPSFLLPAYLFLLLIFQTKYDLLKRV